MIYQRRKNVSIFENKLVYWDSMNVFIHLLFFASIIRQIDKFLIYLQCFLNLNHFLGMYQRYLGENEVQRGLLIFKKLGFPYDKLNW